MTLHSPLTGILITGASGGLGRELVRLSASFPGVDAIIATDIDEAVYRHFAGHEKVIAKKMDVGSEASIRKVKDEISEKGIRIRYLINNAGTHAFFPVSESTEQLLDKILRVNLYGPVLTVSAFLDDLIATRGRVVQISSDSVRLPIPFYIYPATKIAMEAFSVSMRRELGLYGISLVIVRPGAMQTPFLDGMDKIQNEAVNSRYQQWFENFAILSWKSVGNRSVPSEVAGLVMKALVVKKPRTTYAINRNRKISFFQFFPERLKDMLIRRSVL
jgi:NAD(P)-dependent dehydrogenase (short-subunit alcohol dehydrogenase family)